MKCRRTVTSARELHVLPDTLLYGGFYLDTTKAQVLQRVHYRADVAEHQLVVSGVARGRRVARPLRAAESVV